MSTSLKKIIQLSLVLIIVADTVLATHMSNRYFPFIERPEDYFIKNRSHLSPAFFYVQSSHAYLHDGDDSERRKVGIPEVWGDYNLQDIVKSLQAVQPGVNPFALVPGGIDVESAKSLRFHVEGDIKAYGVTLGYEQAGPYGLQFGAWIPIMGIHTTQHFIFDAAKSEGIPASGPQGTHDQYLVIDEVRRKTHQLIGFNGNVYDAGGFGDLDLHVRWSGMLDHVLLMRTISGMMQLGFLTPLGVRKNNGYPSSVPFGTNGSFGLYADSAFELELKPDISVGLIGGMLWQFADVHKVRLSVGHEPTIYSALQSNVRIQPGFTYKVSPYLTLSNLADGLDFQVRYTYLQHFSDHWRRVGNFYPKVSGDHFKVPSYLDNPALVREKERLSAWTAHYVTLQLSYDSKEAMKDYVLQPTFFASADIPAAGAGIVEAYQFIIGAELHF